MFAELLRERLAGVVELSTAQAAALEAHYNLMVRWNRTINLTTVTEESEAVERHYCESLFLGATLPPGPLRIVDIGSGPGFPGFPVAVLRPACSVTLVEAHQRKAVFLKEAARQMPNVRVLAVRAHDVREQFDWAISRAVSYRDLLPDLQRLAENADLLTGGEEPPADLGFIWDPSIPLPWGNQRFLRRGRRVSRETGGI